MHGSQDKRTELLNRARSIAPIIESEADRVEAETEITRRIHDALVDQELYWIPLPRAYGGADADIATIIEVVEEIARADGSTGWSYFANIATIGALFPFVSEETLAIIAEGDRPVMAGQLVPVGRSEKVGEDYRCSGRHGFASGSVFANWICATQILHEDGMPIVGEGGIPRSTIALLRVDEVEFQGNWDVMGLAGTGSYDYEVRERVVPAARVTDGGILAPDAVPLRGSATLRMGALALAYAVHSACALGIAKRAIEEITAITTKKSRPGYPGKIAQDPVFLNDFALIDADFHAAHGHLVSVFAQMEAKVALGDRLAPADHAVMRQTATWSHRMAGKVVADCFRWAGTTPVRNPSALGRCMRDVLVANSHMLFDPKSLTDAAPLLMERWAGKA